MAKTQAQIDRIHQDRTAIAGRVYEGPKQVLYVGSKKGHLIQETFLRGDVEGTSLNSRIKSLGKYSTEEIEEILNKKEAEGGQGLTITAARKKKVSNSYLEINEVFMNQVPIVLAEDTTLDSILVSSLDSETWTAEIHNDYSLITGASISIVGEAEASATGLNITLSAGTKLMFYVNGSGVRKPRITIICK
jgi:hypothetical protein